MSKKPERYSPQESYKNDPRSHITGILQMITAQTKEEGLHGNVEPFITALTNALRYRPYVDITLVISTLEQIRKEQEKAAKPDRHDWRQKAIIEVIKKLTPLKKK